MLLEITPHTSLMIKFLFPEAYPHELVLMELKSVYLDGELLEKLKLAAELEARKSLGKKQILKTVQRLKTILAKNRLAPAFADLKQVIFDSRSCLIFNVSCEVTSRTRIAL